MNETPSTSVSPWVMPGLPEKPKSKLLKTILKQIGQNGGFSATLHYLVTENYRLFISGDDLMKAKRFFYKNPCPAPKEIKDKYVPLNKHWTDREDKIIIDNAKLTYVELQLLLPHRSLNSVTCRKTTLRKQMKIPIYTNSRNADWLAARYARKF